MSCEKQPNVDILKLQLEIWKESIAATKHFNEMSVKMRQLGLTFVVAAFALAITLLSQFPAARVSVPIGDWYYDIHLSGLIIISAALGLLVTRLLDLKVYHQMLRGSVAFTEALENESLVKQLMGTERGLAQTISYYSRTKSSSLRKGVPPKRTTAEWKIRAFYIWSIIFIMATGIAVTVITTEKVERRSTIINQRIEVREPTN